ncbi:HAMP domain-containing histidine kinase [Campylobacter upsaliensis]|uniref:sensor histidine kinase n=1 Tax=Campylobacter upsaliensis TaxID=28080 RepID=UPI00127066B2|nr:HAMP domain-containing sensor histidine kinase [Campylobacter upsaliensis]EAI7128710.1 HAMP domain-containing histidine kinase [Campylobacter upsaliensis]EAI7129845.1 HAMP domain-containing histidine kinase [Campylobacter upsaliensis]EAJ1632627.1 HAMP domain-containing histidine kinase [Campylobacter upsaliensis]EAK9896891.1 HAMP domain-containing histidine kinase [Campylobacter upsaliensis]EAK9898625.1 HAMP domain-containing histidine kinase [Campylobacter upsaliensis]
MAKKVIWQILLIYLTTTGVFLSIFFSIWYEKLYEDLILIKGENLREIRRTIVVNIANNRFVPLEENAANIAKSARVQFAIFDKERAFFNNLDLNYTQAKIRLKGRGVSEGRVFFMAPMSLSEYYLGQTKGHVENDEGLKILIQGEDVSRDLLLIKLKVLSFALLAFGILALIAYILVKISLKPMEEKIETLNRFIKDSTHEINTPLSVILMSIEQLERQNLEQSAKFLRIKLAAKTLHQIYSDLVFYNFSHTLSNEKESFDLGVLIKERVEYFRLFFEQKKLCLKLDLNTHSLFFANKNQISKLIDNLLSNAIKYNKKGGEIAIVLKENSLVIKDSGCGISKENLMHIFERYARFNEDQGGFGIGLSLVKKICEENDILISCESKEGEGSAFRLEWELLA